MAPLWSPRCGGGTRSSLLTSGRLTGVGIYMDGQDRQDGGPLVLVARPPLGRNRALARAMYGGRGARIALDSGFRRNDEYLDAINRASTSKTYLCEGPAPLWSPRCGGGMGATCCAPTALSPASLQRRVLERGWTPAFAGVTGMDCWLLLTIRQGCRITASPARGHRYPCIRRLTGAAREARFVSQILSRSGS